MLGGSHWVIGFQTNSKSNSQIKNQLFSFWVKTKLETSFFKKNIRMGFHMKIQI